MRDNPNWPEGPISPDRRRGVGPLSLGRSGVHEPLSFSVPCPCERWRWREILASTAPGLTVAERFCPRCREPYLIVKRVQVTPLGVELVGVVRSLGRDVAALRRSLRGLELRPGEEAVLAAVAPLFAEAATTPAAS